MPLNTPIDTRVVPGSNEAPDFAKEVTDRIASEYVGLTNTLDELVNEMPKLPEQVKSDADALMTGALIKRFRDLDSRVDGVRVLEKEPYLRGGNAVDAFFFGLRDLIGKRNKSDRKAKDGYADILQARINVFQNEKIAAEQARLQAERVARERAEREAREKAAEEQRLAEEARLAAERARTAHTKAAKDAAAAEQERIAAERKVAEQRAAEAAEDARLASLAKPADIARVRGNAAAGGGVTLTVAQEPYAAVEDRTKLDWSKIAPFFTDAEVEKALRAWARTTGHRVQMDGAAIGFRNKGVTR
jgi:hypothetical protein